MTANPIDPEEIVLREAVVETQLALHQFDADVEAGKIDDEFGMRRENVYEPPAYKAIEALRAFRAKASAPVAPERCEPPAEFRGEPYHWLKGSSDKLRPGQWDTRDGGWRISGCEWQDVRQITEWGWTWHSVCHPNRHIPPTDEALREFMTPRMVTDDRAIQNAKAILSHFSPTVSPRSDSDSVSRAAYESVINDRQDFRSAYRRERDARKHLEWALSSFANPANWIDEPGNLQWNAKLHAIVFAANVLIEANHMVEDCAEPSPLNTSTANGLEQENASQPAGSVQQEPSDAQIEAAAKRVYAAFDPPAGSEIWIARGNSLKQDEARKYARAALSAKSRCLPTQTSITDEEINGLAAIECSYTEPGKVLGEMFYVFSPRLIIEFARTLLSQHSNPISGETPTIESVRELVEKMPRGTIWKTQLAELVEYTKAAVVRFGVGR